MKKIDLKKRIQELEKLVEAQSNIIEILQTQLGYNFPNYINTDIDCIDGKGHEYPNPWHSVTAPSCKKCGKMADTYQIYSTSNGTANLDYPPAFTNYDNNIAIAYSAGESVFAADAKITHVNGVVVQGLDNVNISIIPPTIGE